MGGLKRMNGLPLTYTAFADFNDSWRSSTEIGKHTSFEAFEASKLRLGPNARKTYGWMWVEYCEERIDPLPNIVKKPRLRELILPEQREWHRARIQAKKENELLAVLIGYASCCLKMTHCIDDHQMTTRHFRYWALEYQPHALKAFPWLKNMIAEEVLT